MVCYCFSRARHLSLAAAASLLGFAASAHAEAASPELESAVPVEVQASGEAPSPVVVPSMPEPVPAASLELEEVPPPFTSDEAGGFLWSFVKSMLMLALVLGLAYLVLHQGLGRLVQRTQGGRRVRVVERVPLEQRRSLYLVEVDGQEILLAGTDGAITPIPTWRPRGSVSDVAGREFSDELRRVNRAAGFSEGLAAPATGIGGTTSSHEKVEG